MFAFLPQETRNQLLSLPRVTIVVNIRKNRIRRDNDWGKTPSLSPFSLLSYSITEQVKVPFHSAPFQYWRFLGFMVQSMIEDFTIRWSITRPNNGYFGAKFSNFFHFKGKQSKTIDGLTPENVTLKYWEIEDTIFLQPMKNLQPSEHRNWYAHLQSFCFGEISVA